MNYLIILGCLLASTMAQRPSFAGIFPKGPEYADVHNNFRVNTTSPPQSVAVAAPPQGQPGNAEADLANRVGEAESTTIRLPPEANGNANLVQWIQKWPQGNKPFWLINAEHLNKHRHPENNGGNTASNGSSGTNGNNNVVVAIPNRNSFDNSYTLDEFFADIDKEEYEKFKKHSLQQINPDYYSEFNNRNIQQLSNINEQPQQQRLTNDNFDNTRQLKGGRRIFFPRI